MSQKSKAVVFRSAQNPFSVEEVEVLSPGPDEVMVKVAACGVCHSDLSATNGGTCEGRRVNRGSELQCLPG